MQATAVSTDIVLLDIAGFSKLSDEGQLASVLLLNEELRRFLKRLPVRSFQKVHQIVLDVIPSGDGFYIILNQAFAGYGPLCALSIRNALLTAGAKQGLLFEGVRLACHLGRVQPFTDITGRTNYVGTGVNDCARLLQSSRIRNEARRFSGDSNYVIVSSHAWRAFERLFPDAEFGGFFDLIELRASVQRVFEDKHGKTHRVRILESSRTLSVSPPKPSNPASEGGE